MFPDSTYHLFNHANGWENLFEQEKNYAFFLGRLSLHVLPVAHIYAYCLMPNHFHLMVKIRDATALKEHFRQLKEKQLTEKAGHISVSVPEEDISEAVLIRKISRPFSNCFNSYTQAFNKMYKRMGSLFMPNMKTQEIFDDVSFCRVVQYIHTNPVHHGFVKNINGWPHSSYNIFLSKKPTKLEREYVLKIFGGYEGFVKYHEQPIDPKNKWVDS